jgi:hypothetical protein
MRSAHGLITVGTVATDYSAANPPRGTGAPAASGYIGALILCGAATCAGALVACATPRKSPR